MTTTSRPDREHASRSGRGRLLRDLGDVLRGLWAVLLLFVTGADALVTALLGIKPVTPRLVLLGREIADEYRRGRADAIDAEVIEIEYTPAAPSGADPQERP